jgi:hypothetical protein
MTLYATGARRAEAARLKVSDIDSQRMVVHIREGKGGKDRDVMLSPKLLDALRVYWRGLRRKPTDWLFPGNRWHTASYPVTTKVLWTACQKAAERAGLAHKHIHPQAIASLLQSIVLAVRIDKLLAEGFISLDRSSEEAAALHGGTARKSRSIELKHEPPVDGVAFFQKRRGLLGGWIRQFLPKSGLESKDAQNQSQSAQAVPKGFYNAHGVPLD